MFEIHWRYYADNDTLSLFFTRTSPGVIEHSEDVAPCMVCVQAHWLGHVSNILSYKQMSQGLPDAMVLYTIINAAYL
jgi:hypothetical protein